MIGSQKKAEIVGFVFKTIRNTDSEIHHMFDVFFM